MTKQKKIDFINRVFLKFYDARNHGGHNNWWYPSHNVIAYNVKMHKWANVESLRKHLTARQSEFYTDEQLQNYIDYNMEDQCRLLIDEVKEKGAKDAWFAGRSGGWLEVEYTNELTELESDTSEDVQYFYSIAVKLEKLEAEIAQLIADEHGALNKYIHTPEYYKDIAEHLQSDEDIADEYRAKIANLSKKLK